MKRLFLYLLAGGIGVLCTGLRAEATSKPSLVVIIVIDQFRGDYLDAFGDHFVDGGFKRLMRDGAWFDHAYYTYGSLATGPGHASIATGATPSAHGIVGNNWYALDEGEASRYCCGDPDVRNLGYPTGRSGDGRSPKLLVTQTVGDCVKASTAGKGEVWGIALKDRAAILTAGKDANGAAWWDSNSGRFITSTYYGPNLPEWIRALNESGYRDRFFKTSWELLLPVGMYDAKLLDAKLFAGAGADTYRKYHAGKFPKILGQDQEKPNRAYYRDLYASPFGNNLVFEAARRVIVAKKLGHDDATDVLTVSLSSNDLIGHLFGPDSPEVMDCTLRTDRQLADFFDWLDETVGLKRCIVALSSDHGVGPIAEYAKAAGVGGGRLRPADLLAHIDAALKKRIPSATDGPSLVRNVIFPWVYLDEKAIRSAGYDIDDASRIAANAARNFEGVAEAFAAADVRGSGFVGSSELRQCVRNSYFPGRSGHVYIHWKRFWYQGKKIAGHGSAYDYDQHVPVMLMGAGIKPGRYTTRVRPTGLAVTLCKLLGIDPPRGSTGKVYLEALWPQP